MQSTLDAFQETQSPDAFTLQNSKLLKVSLDQITIQAKLGSMVAYQGDVRFEHAGSGGMGRLLKKAVTGEGTRLMKIEGTGEVFLAVQAQDVHLIKLEKGDHRPTIEMLARIAEATGRDLRWFVDPEVDPSPFPAEREDAA